MYASVVIDAVIGTGNSQFDYIIPNDMRVEPGARVLVPFGKQVTEGFVLSVSENTDVPADKLKAILRVMDEFVAVTLEFLAILDSVCDKFKLRKIDVLRLFVPSALRGRKTGRVRRRDAPKSIEFRGVNEVVLTEQQQAAVDEIIGDAQTFVLHGVTGSGKTEVYMRVIEYFIGMGKSAIMLVPEIGLTPQVLSTFRARFGETVAILHSGLTVGERYDEWLRLRKGDAKIALGARSAIFAPVQDLGVVIIDEEHDGSYFSESNPRFCTHDIAKLRCGFNKCALVLGSATPSIETYYRATVLNEYKLLNMTARVNDIQMPEVELVDMAAELRSGHGGIFSRALISRLMDTVAAGNQAMIFINRRGFSSHVMCTSCGWVPKCDACDVSLVYHKEEKRLKCHFCDRRLTEVRTCQKCGCENVNAGRKGTQKLVEELQALLPDVPVMRMDADNTKTKDSLVDILDKFAKTSPAILVGTQMIAKGHHFPKVGLVGIIDTDNSLHFSDYRASERTFALVTQVAGRAGRECCEGGVCTGCVVLQTYMPSHYVYRLAATYNYKGFFEKEINSRQVTNYPPFTTIARILVTGVVDAPIKKMIQEIMMTLRTRPEKDFTYIGAMKSPVGRIQNKFRYQILMRFARGKENEMLDFIDKAVKGVDVPRNCHVFLEINPQNLS